jgi:hypothetical protein
MAAAPLPRRSRSASSPGAACPAGRSPLIAAGAALATSAVAVFLDRVRAARKARTTTA